MHMFWATIADGKPAASWGEEQKKQQKLNLSPLLDGSKLGGSLGARWLELQMSLCTGQPEIIAFKTFRTQLLM